MRMLRSRVARLLVGACLFLSVVIIAWCVWTYRSEYAAVESRIGAGLAQLEAAARANNLKGVRAATAQLSQFKTEVNYDSVRPYMFLEILGKEDPKRSWFGEFSGRIHALEFTIEHEDDDPNRGPGAIFLARDVPPPNYIWIISKRPAPLAITLAICGILFGILLSWGLWVFGGWFMRMIRGREDGKPDVAEQGDKGWTGAQLNTLTAQVRKSGAV